MQPRRYLSPLQVSQALGVSVTTVKRWVDDGVLPAHKTAGGHRRILIGDVLRMVREGNWPHINLALLTGPLPVVDAPNATCLSERFYEVLVRGDAEGARHLLEEAYRGGMRSEVLADQVIAPVMERIGRAWQGGTLDLFQEHRATQLCLAALHALRPRIEAACVNRPLALGGGPESDHYQVANLLIELILLENGWQVVLIGPNTPLASFRRAIRQLKPRLFWLSCSYLPDPDAFVAEYQELYAEARQANVAVAVGGRALVESIRSRIQYTTFGDGLSQFGDFLRQLHRPPRAPGTGAGQGRNDGKEAESRETLPGAS